MARACLQYSWQMMASRVIRMALVILLYYSIIIFLWLSFDYYILIFIQF